MCLLTWSTGRSPALPQSDDHTGESASSKVATTKAIDNGCQKDHNLEQSHAFARVLRGKLRMARRKPKMPEPKSHDGPNKQRDQSWIDSAWEAVSSHLENGIRHVREEIKDYPRPIPACDLQFNQLLEVRASISQELNRMRQEMLGCDDPIQALHAFIQSSKHIDGEMMKRIMSFLKNKHPMA
jgi:hypothetical protein